MFSRYTFITLFVLSGIQSQASSDYIKLKSGLKNNLKWFSDEYIHSDYKKNGIDIDSLAAETETMLVKLLSFKESLGLDLKELPNLFLLTQSKDNLHIRFYSFSHGVGPSGYEAVHTVIQWVNADHKVFSYLISNKLPGTIGSIQPLKSDKRLYLLFANDYYTSIAYIIHLKGNYLIMDYPAFLNSPEIRLEKTDLDFNEVSQELTIKGSDEGESIFDEEKLTHMKVNPFKNPSYPALVKKFEDLFSTTDNIRLKFDGEKFIK